MAPKTFILIGRSGCGKGTQAELLKEHLEKNVSEFSVLYIETGAKFRKFVKGDSYTSEIAREVNDAGKLQSSFLATWMWSNILIEKLTGKEHLVLDGIPRKLNEAKILDGALMFWKRVKPNFIFINVSEKWARERLSGRGRKDDSNNDNVDSKMEWYKSDVVPAIEHFKDRDNYNFLDINGEQTIEEVHKDIIKKIQ